ncbi:MAG: PQQ-dependent sugar dehydrogenase, partial [Saprospiraceae bacterium]|nr:PQQ-dependent sugar dehydrogenase [Saprospiraceae bacterium]
EKTRWVYLFYTDPLRKSYQHISRFVFDGDSLHMSSEQLLLEYFIDWENCCHFGGALDFGPDGLLYISTGDNTGGTESAPIDEREGHYLGDAQRSSANTMDHRGKILRIKPEDDGTYSIPDGNLFPPEDTLALPEIYTMGLRNPWKLKVDQKTGWLYWGEVGPNPGTAVPERGPVSYEEINQAKAAGNFGWPYILADNKPYRDYNYATEEVGEFFDPDSLINDSPNNEGHRELPPAQKAIIWYPNLPSDTFPLSGQGGGTVIVGPVYHYPSRAGLSSFPSYYDNFLFMGEWMRGWLRAVQLDRQGRYMRMESFLPDTTFRKPIDMAFSPKGVLYVLDYGSNWYVHNEDAQLARVSYNQGNRKPRAVAKVSPLQAAVPAEIYCSAHRSSDPDGDSLRFRWSISDLQKTVDRVETVFTISEAGNYRVGLTVTDQSGASDIIETDLVLGNDPPSIEVQLENRSFYQPGQSIPYQVLVRDAEDGSSDEGGISEEDIKVDIRSLSNDIDLNLVRSTSVFINPTFNHLSGKKLLQNSDCLACHHHQDTSAGPSFISVADRYEGNSAVASYLINKISQGGVGAWGQKLMTAHPQHTDDEMLQMVQYILSLNDEPEWSPQLVQGQVPDSLTSSDNYLVISSLYLDQGVGEIPPTSTHRQEILRPYKVHATQYDRAYRVVPKPYNDFGGKFAEIALTGSYIGWKNIDLSGIVGLSLRLRSGSNTIKAEIRQQSAQGPIVGVKTFDVPSVENYWNMQEKDWFWEDIDIDPSPEVQDLFIVFYSDRTEGALIYYEICQLEWVEFMRQPGM